ncbi:hypothetical protein QOZ88_04420 [Blastococcus sp. BMG 814]|uniref:Uncharacterized protein n=1 Tax=Blastococcus carthaginiensis TaxID=3050034 RepID=A0ABT9I8H0_9ACTN|nr:hypothetical protein [Blastococcus carthaginiensis]MDP5181871.1 hypothetical protein [Blastococcus carthaginiensis]
MLGHKVDDPLYAFVPRLRRTTRRWATSAFWAANTWASRAVPLYREAVGLDAATTTDVRKAVSPVTAVSR